MITEWADKKEDCKAILEECALEMKQHTDTVEHLKLVIEALETNGIPTSNEEKETISIFTKYYQFNEESPLPKEIPNQLNFDTLINEFDSLAIRSAIDGLSNWNIDKSLIEKILGPTLLQKISNLREGITVNEFDQICESKSISNGMGGSAVSFHGTTKEAAEKIVLNGQKIGHVACTGAYTGDLRQASGYIKDGGGMVFTTRFFLHENYINRGRVTDCSAIDNKEAFTRIPSRINFDVSNNIDEAFRILKLQERIINNPEIANELKSRFHTYLESLGETFQSNITKLYQEMRQYDYGEPKIIECADYYLRQVMTADSSPESAKRKTIIEKLFANPIEKVTSATIIDCLMEDKTNTEKSILDRLPSTETISQMTSDELVAQIQRSIRKQQIEFAQKGVNGEAVQTIKNQVESYIKIANPEPTEADELRQQIKGTLPLFLGEINGENLNKANQDINEIKERIQQFRKRILHFIAEELNKKFSENTDWQKHKDHCELVLTGSSGRGDATIKSDLDCLLLFDDRNISKEGFEEIAPLFNEYNSALTEMLTELGFKPDTDKAQGGAFPTRLTHLIGLSMEGKTIDSKVYVEPTNIIDLESVSDTPNNLVNLFKKIFQQKFADLEHQRHLDKSLKMDTQKYIPRWYEGYSQLLNGDSVKDIKFELVRILDFYLFRTLVTHLDELKAETEKTGEEFVIPADNLEKISVLEKLGALTKTDAQTLKQGVTDLFRWRLRSEIIGNDELAASSMTLPERKRAIELAKTINQLIEDLKEPLSNVIIS